MRAGRHRYHAVRMRDGADARRVEMLNAQASGVYLIAATPFKDVASSTFPVSTSLPTGTSRGASTV